MIEFIKKHKKAFIIGGCVVVGGALTWWLVGPEIVTVLASLVAPAAGAASALPADKNDSADRKKDEESYPSEPDLSQKEEPEEKRKYTNPVEQVNYRSHTRNLPEGWHASEKKIQMAKESGIDLKDRQTLISEYTKYNHTESDEERTNENRD